MVAIVSPSTPCFLTSDDWRVCSRCFLSSKYDLGLLSLMLLLRKIPSDPKFLAYTHLHCIPTAVKSEGAAPVDLQRNAGRMAKDLSDLGVFVFSPWLFLFSGAVSFNFDSTAVVRVFVSL